MSETITKNSEEIMEQEQTETKPYTFRPLETADLFPMFKLLQKMGFKELKENEGLKKVIFLFMGGNADKKIDVNEIGIDIFFEVAGIVVDAIPKIENELYTLLSSVAGVKPEAIKKQSPAVTFEMIIDFIRKEEFKDFFRVVLKLFK